MKCWRIRSIESPGHFAYAHDDENRYTKYECDKPKTGSQLPVALPKSRFTVVSSMWSIVVDLLWQNNRRSRSLCLNNLKSSDKRVNRLRLALVANTDLIVDRISNRRPSFAGPNILDVDKDGLAAIGRFDKTESSRVVPLDELAVMPFRFDRVHCPPLEAQPVCHNSNKPCSSWRRVGHSSGKQMRCAWS